MDHYSHQRRNLTRMWEYKNKVHTKWEIIVIFLDQYYVLCQQNYLDFHLNNFSNSSSLLVNTYTSLILNTFIFKNSYKTVTQNKVFERPLTLQPSMQFKLLLDFDAKLNYASTKYTCKFLHLVLICLIKKYLQTLYSQHALSSTNEGRFV